MCSYDKNGAADSTVDVSTSYDLETAQLKIEARSTGDAQSDVEIDEEEFHRFFDVVFSQCANRLRVDLEKDLRGNASQIFNKDDFDTIFDCTFEHYFDCIGFDCTTTDPDNIETNVQALYTDIYSDLRQKILDGLIQFRDDDIVASKSATIH
jgi:hypothetical protein